eukprot:TRINITY_DN7579_c0_g1_i1.p1 TRINITY_DN7579_c0_g1~~TRINITY_DN7579_c0_g1_i1.p1  ORF type:complete len:177 (-),score=14.55 TRINITY_DN7579_c0_g1_i1:86-616(-)
MDNYRFSCSSELATIRQNECMNDVRKRERDKATKKLREELARFSGGSCGVQVGQTSCKLGLSMACCGYTIDYLHFLDNKFNGTPATLMDKYMTSCSSEERAQTKKCIHDAGRLAGACPVTVFDTTCELEGFSSLTCCELSQDYLCADFQRSQYNGNWPPCVKFKLNGTYETLKKST